MKNISWHWDPTAAQIAEDLVRHLGPSAEQIVEDLVRYLGPTAEQIEELVAAAIVPSVNHMDGPASHTGFSNLESAKSLAVDFPTD